MTSVRPAASSERSCACAGDAFSEENEVRFVQPPARAAGRKRLQQLRARLHARAAVQAQEQAGVAVELDDGAAAREVMQIVDVLRDEDLQLPASGPAPRASRAASTTVRRVRLRLAEVVVEDFLDHRPGLLGVGQEVVRAPAFAGHTWSTGRRRRGKAGCRFQRRCPRL